jgi:hypothetical protein
MTTRDARRHTDCTKRTDPDERLVRQTELLRMGAKAAWSGISVNPEIITAVIDSGVQLDHPDLETQLVAGATFPCLDKPCDGAANGVPHGTTMAGIIAAARGNGGIVGTAYNTKVMPLNVTNEFGFTNDALVSEAIEHALSHGARVLNLSFVSDARTTSIERVINEATQDFLMIVPAGNVSRNIDLEGKESFPASLKNKQKILVVMSHDSTDSRESVSAWGNETVDIAAPGAVDSAVICIGSVCYGYSENSTSNAAAYVSGAAALLWSMYPDWKGQDIRWRILATRLRADTLAPFMGPPQKLNLERMMFPVSFLGADEQRRIRKMKLRAIDLASASSSSQFDLSTTFPDGMCASTEVALIRANGSAQELLVPEMVNEGDSVQFLATGHRSTGSRYTARSVVYEIID